VFHFRHPISFADPAAGPFIRPMNPPLALSLAFTLPASAALTQFRLEDYRLVETIPLVLPGNTEASGVTYNKDNNRLYIVEDEGLTLYETDTRGNVLSTMTMSGFADVEGITYIGNGQFLLVEERVQDIFKITYTPGGTLRRATLPFFSFGPEVGNVGLEGVSYDPVTGRIIGVKEKIAQALYFADVNLATMGGTVTGFDPGLSSTLQDLADVQSLGTVLSLQGTADAANLLVISQESSRLVEINRAGTILGQFDFTGFSTSAEGVTIDQDGTIYVVSEDPKLFIFKPVPEPSCAVLVVAGLAIVRRRRRI
jgi:uncharacterized protein YjiK